MSDKPVAGLVTAAIVAPIAAACCLGPVALASGAAAIFAWSAELPAVYFVLWTVAAGLIAIGRRGRHVLVGRFHARDANV